MLYTTNPTERSAAATEHSTRESDLESSVESHRALGGISGVGSEYIYQQAIASQWKRRISSDSKASKNNMIKMLHQPFPTFNTLLG